MALIDLRLLCADDIEHVLDVQDRIRSALDDEDLFPPSTRRFVAHCLAGGGFLYGGFHDGELVGYRIVHLPREHEFTLARHIPLPAGEWPRVAHFDTVAVLPEWRGHGISGVLNRRALADLRDREFRHVLATSSPRNPHGIRQLMAAGFRPVRFVERVGGTIRLLSYRPLPHGWPDVDGDSPERVVPLSDLLSLAAVLRSGWVGHEVIPDTDGFRLRVRRHPAPYLP